MSSQETIDESEISIIQEKSTQNDSHTIETYKFIEFEDKDFFYEWLEPEKSRLESHA